MFSFHVRLYDHNLASWPDLHLFTVKALYELKGGSCPKALVLGLPIVDVALVLQAVVGMSLTQSFERRPMSQGYPGHMTSQVR